MKGLTEFDISLPNLRTLAGMASERIDWNRHFASRSTYDSRNGWWGIRLKLLFRLKIYVREQERLTRGLTETAISLPNLRKVAGMAVRGTDRIGYSPKRLNQRKYFCITDCFRLENQYYYSYFITQRIQAESACFIEFRTEFILFSHVQTCIFISINI